MGIEGFFHLPPWGVDVQRAYKLMTSMEEDGMIEITNNKED